jgi:uncharacterized membrane protein
MTAFWKSFTDQQRAMLKRAIEVAEMDTSGEIRVHIENKCPVDPFDRAAYIFARMEMHKTGLRNGVLFYVAVSDRKLVILGDAGINAVVGTDFWESTKDLVLGYFRDEKFVEGLVAGITQTGALLKKHFPYQQGDVNELSDDISFGEDIYDR